jgi:hypothetical protein
LFWSPLSIFSTLRVRGREAAERSPSQPTIEAANNAATTPAVH